MAYGDRAACRSCGREIIQIGGGHRQRQYCEEFASRFAAVIDAEKAQSSHLATGDVSLVRLGSQLDYPELHVKHPGGGHAVVLRAGKANWLHFADVAEGRLIRAVEHAARAILRGEESLP